MEHESVALERVTETSPGAHLEFLQKYIIRVFQALKTVVQILQYFPSCFTSASFKKGRRRPGRLTSSRGEFIYFFFKGRCVLDVMHCGKKAYCKANVANGSSDNESSKRS